MKDAAAMAEAVWHGYLRRVGGNNQQGALNMTTVDFASNMAQSMSGITDLMAALFYMAGTFSGIRGAVSLKGHNDNPEAIRLSQPLTMFIVSGMLLAIPTFLSTSINEVSGKNTNAAARAIVPAADQSVASASASTPVATVALGAPKAEALASTELPPKTLDPASADLWAMLEALGGLGLLALGGWGMLLSARKSEAQREAQIESGLLRSKGFGEEQK